MINVAVCTSNFRFYLMLNELLSKIETIRVNHLLPKDMIPPNIDVVITTYAEKEQIKSEKIFVPKTINDIYIISNIYLISNKIEEFTVCNIGIDPGKSTGMAIFGDKILIKVIEHHSVIDVIKTIILAYFNVPAKNFLILLGSNGGKEKEEILTRLKAIFKDKILIKLIDETKTSKPLVFRGKKYKKNLAAAIQIALSSV